MRLIFLALPWLTACAEGTSPRDPATGLNVDYAIPLGAEFMREPSGIPEDSRGDIWNAPGVRVATDLGEYGPEPDCDGKPCERFMLGEFPALLQRVRLDDGGGQLHLSAMVYEPYDLRLVVVATCEEAARCEEMVPVLRATKIRILDQ